MHVVIMGCGRVGSELANRLEVRGHTVVVIDKREIAFRMLRFDFKGQKVHGYGFDEDVLRQAGIERAGAFAAVSNGDNSNIVASSSPTRSPPTGRTRATGSRWSPWSCPPRGRAGPWSSSSPAATAGWWG